ncbi:MAG TPA: hypothetical protein VMV10_19255 [Pirellulales bacterium]|nr:hypothetical protein [Pirellulales bacterium]
MKHETMKLFELLRKAIDRWSDASGHRDAYIRGSQARKDLACQISRYRFMLGRDGFLDKLRKSFDKPTVHDKHSESE